VSAFVDTSALLAVLHASDANHRRAAKTWRALLESGEEFVVTSYVLVETVALLQHRFGLTAARAFQEDVEPVLRVIWVDADLHREGMAALLTAGRRELSLVDCVSFACMRRLGIAQAFHFDRHFTEQGFEFAGS
jgi:predicted nucleic acid-binding protein